jgi:hypothetical protein
MGSAAPCSGTATTAGCRRGSSSQARDAKHLERLRRFVEDTKFAADNGRRGCRAAGSALVSTKKTADLGKRRCRPDGSALVRRKRGRRALGSARDSTKRGRRRGGRPWNRRKRGRRALGGAIVSTKAIADVDQRRCRPGGGTAARRKRGCPPHGGSAARTKRGCRPDGGSSTKRTRMSARGRRAG